MVASTDIKFFVHTNHNAPQLENAYGSMINVLNACLIDGINIGTVSSLTATGTTVTALFSSSHNLMQCQVIKITGAAQSEFNGEHRILTIPNSSSLTFELAAAPSVTTATGAISASLPPLGWEKPFSSTHSSGVGGKAAYRSTNLLLPSRPFLRVVDELDPVYKAAYAKYAKVGIVEDMDDIDAMKGVQAPFDPAKPNKNWVGTGSGTSAFNGWAKWYYALGNDENTSGNKTVSPPNGVRNWVVVGNKDCFYVLNRFHTIATYEDRLFPHFFGAIDTTFSKVFGLAATFDYSSASTEIYQYDSTAISVCDITNHFILQRKSDMSPESTFCTTRNLTASGARSGYEDYIPAPNSTTPVFSFKQTLYEGSLPRGTLPLIEFLPQRKPYQHLTTFQADSNFKIAVDCLAYASGQLLFSLGD